MSEMASAISVSPPVRQRTGRYLGREDHLSAGRTARRGCRVRGSPRGRCWGVGPVGLERGRSSSWSRTRHQRGPGSVERPGPGLGRRRAAGVPGVWLWMTSDGRQASWRWGRQPAAARPGRKGREEEGGRDCAGRDGSAQAWGDYSSRPTSPARTARKRGRKISSGLGSALRDPRPAATARMVSYAIRSLR